MNWYSPGSSIVHRLAPQAKLVSMLLFLVCVVSAERWPVLAFDTALVLAIWRCARLPIGLFRRLWIESPFLVFVALLPFVATGPRTTLFGVPVSESGLKSAGLLFAKITIAVIAAIIYSATTSSSAFVTGLERLRVPSAFVAILAAMIRYLSLTQSQFRQTLVAMRSRSGSRRSLLATGQVVGTQFIRTFERGERVYLARLSRGGSTVALAQPAPITDWFWAAVLPIAALFAGVAP